ncbi:fatty acid cis/trans isomerase [Cellvibrio mixtus]|uniref:fatty acid cis/trans isomerase n=1 Tax=Cellvibrio mixtus TaxID=39650 RepID=UPI000694154F|nr:fatty acid cis/trans isomerase [Cellvibrio mixtus]
MKTTVWVKLNKLTSQLRPASLGIIALMIASCASISSSEWDKLYGPANPREVPPALSTAKLAAAKLTYYQHTRPILEQRCVVCHACYDAPCQLKLEAYEGLLRGANPEKVYDGTRLLGANLTRLFEDAQTTAEWRAKKFHPVINERENTKQANIDAGVMAQILKLKQEHPLPQDAVLPDSFDFNLNHNQSCSNIENFNGFVQRAPLWGMPYGLPGLNAKEYKMTMDWLAQGAPMGQPTSIPAKVQNQVALWETFLNGDSLKEQLVNRYIYEHLFLAQLYFAEAPRSYFRLIRSATPPGQPIQRISTSRPFDDPNVPRVYYRLWQDPSSVVAKTHMPYALGKKRMDDWKALFYSGDYVVTQLPSYMPETAANPFVTFAELPTNARYRFMLNEAQFTIMNFIKGPVCRGQVALNVIQDHFWVFFLAPETQDTKGMEKFLADNSKHLQLPASAGNTFLPLSNWLKYSELQKEYLNSKAHFVNQVVDEERGLGLNVIWNGDKGTNPNAALTIFRHSDSASVHQGLIGQPPKTAWVIGYPLLERIHYLLVAGFDVYGNVSHQLLSRLYMDFLRIEGEMNFVTLLPQKAQHQEMAFWYRDAESAVQTYVDLYINQLKEKNNINFQSDNPKLELYQKLQQHLGNASKSPHNIRATALNNEQLALYEKLQSTRGTAISFLPQTTVIEIPGKGLFTLIHNNAYSNLSSLFGEDKRHIPAEDNLTIARGVIGNYPNSFLRVENRSLDAFVTQFQAMASEADYRALLDNYGIRRSNPDFWAFSDHVHELYFRNQPKEAAILDYNRLENR